MTNNDFLSNVKALLNLYSSSEYRIKVVDKPMNSDKIVIYGREFKTPTKFAHFQVFDINNKQIDLIQSYPKILERQHKNQHKVEFLEDVVRAYLDNEGLLAFYKSEDDGPFDSTILNTKLHTEQQYRIALYAFARGLPLSFKWKMEDSIKPSNKEITKWLQIGLGIGVSINLYTNIIKTFQKDIGKMAAHLVNLKDINISQKYDKEKDKIYFELPFTSERSVASLKIRNAIKRGNI